jgi:hypothetical protein
MKLGMTIADAPTKILADTLSRLLPSLGSLLLMLVFVLHAGCSPTSEGENETFAKNKKKVAEYSAKWPGFKDVLAARLKKAESEWPKAKKKSGEEAKAEKMKSVNAIVGKLVGKLDNIKHTSALLERLVKRIKKLKLPKSKSSERKRVTAEARDALDAVEFAMSNAAPADHAEAMALLKEQSSLLWKASGRAEKAQRKLEASGKK